MGPKNILKIIVLFELLVCFSLLIFRDFYIVEISKNYKTDNSLIVIHMYFILCSLGFTIVILTLFASFLNNKSARLMLLGNTIAISVILITLFIFFFTTPFRPPAFILFFLLCITIISFIYYRKTKYDFLD